MKHHSVQNTDQKVTLVMKKLEMGEAGIVKFAVHMHAIREHKCTNDWIVEVEKIHNEFWTRK